MNHHNHCHSPCDAPASAPGLITTSNPPPLTVRDAAGRVNRQKRRPGLSILLAVMALLTASLRTAHSRSFIPIPNPAGSWQEVYAVSRDGTKVFGANLTETYARDCWVWNPADGFTPLFQSQSWLSIGAISASGKVVAGYNYVADVNGTPYLEVVRWSATGGFQNLGIPPNLLDRFPSGTSASLFDYRLWLSADGTTIAGSIGMIVDYDVWYVGYTWDAEHGFTDLGTLGLATGISSDGQVVVGTDCINYLPFIWTLAEGAQAIPLGPVQAGVLPALTADGQQVFGSGRDSSTGNQVVWRWSAATGTQIIGSVPGYESDQYGVGLQFASDSGGTLVGVVSQGNPQRVWRWTAGEGFTLLPAIPGMFYQQATALSADGSTVYGTTRPESGNNPVTWRWTAAEGVQLLGSFDGSQLSGFNFSPASDGWAMDLIYPDISRISGDGSVLVGISHPSAQYEQQAWLAAYRPGIERLTPAQATAGSGDINVTLYGVGFETGSRVFFGASEVATTYVGPTQLQVTVPAATLPSPTDFATLQVTVLCPGGDVSKASAFTIVGTNVIGATSQVQSSVAGAGETASVQTPPSASDSAGVTASLENSAGTTPATVTAATYTENPTSAPAFEAGGGFVDLQVSGADPGDRLSSSFYYPQTVTGGAELALSLRFFNGVAWIDVLSSGGAAPIKNTEDSLDGTVSGGRFQVVFDDTSTPKITELNGTVFAVAIPDTTPPTVSCPNITVPCNVSLLVPVTYSAPTISDNIDPSPRVTYSIASGSGFGVGTTTVVCTATDAAGNSASTTFTVSRQPLEFDGFAEPIDGADDSGGSFANPLRTFKLGSKIRISFELCGCGPMADTEPHRCCGERHYRHRGQHCGGTHLTTGIHTLQVIKWTSQTDSETPLDADSADPRTDGNQFRLADHKWVFVLDTRDTGMSRGKWQFVATLSDGSQHTAWVQIK